MNTDTSPPSSPPRQDHLDAAWAAIALFGTLVSGVMAAAFSLLRLGLETPAALAPGGVAVFGAAAFAPLLLPRHGALADPRVRAVVFPLTTLGTLASVLLAFPIGRPLLILHLLLTAAGMFRAARYLCAVKTRTGFALIAASVATSAYLFVVAGNLGYAGVYTPEQGLLGLLNHDTRFHTALSFLISNFGAPSLGVDGMLPLKYHFGSHIWFAAFGRLTGAEPLWSYGAAVPIVAVPMLLLSLLFAGLCVDNGVKAARAYIAMGVFLLFFSDTIGWQSYYISETYTFALIGLLLLIPLLAELGRREGSRLNRTGFALGVAAIFLLMSLKVSVGVVWAAALGWIALRRWGLRVATWIVGAGSAAALVGGLKVFSPGVGDYVYTTGSLVVPFYFVRAFPDVKAAFSSFVFPLCLASFAIATVRAGGVSIKDALARKSDLLVEAVAIATVAGALPPYLGIPQDSAAWYFLNVGQWFAMPVLLARLSPADFRDLRERIASHRLGGAVAVILLFLLANQLVQSMTPTFHRSIGELLRAAGRQGGGDFLGGRSASRYALDSFKAEHVWFGRDFRAALANSTGPRLIAQVRAAAASPQPDLAVFIPPENKAFWEFQADCRDKHNVQVSLSGQPSLLGEPPKEYDCIRDAYQTNYGANTGSRAIGDPELCAHARERGLRRVLVLRDLYDTSGNRLLNCS